jgi:polyhydroxyalkanoate synthesis regulator phasin
MEPTGMTYDERIDAVATLVAAMVKSGDIFEDQMLELRDDLMTATDDELVEACLEYAFGDLRPAGF